MNADERHRQQQHQRLEQERRQREKALADQHKRQHDAVMAEQRDHFRRLGQAERDRAARNPRPQGGASWSVWFFGGIGALFGAVNPPLQWDGFMGGVLGFLVGGLLGGYLRRFAWGRTVLWVVGLGFVGLVAFAIYGASGA